MSKNTLMTRCSLVSLLVLLAPEPGAARAQTIYFEVTLNELHSNWQTTLDNPATSHVKELQELAVTLQTKLPAWQFQPAAGRYPRLQIALHHGSTKKTVEGAMEAKLWLHEHAVKGANELGNFGLFGLGEFGAILVDDKKAPWFPSIRQRLEVRLHEHLEQLNLRDRLCAVPVSKGQVFQGPRNNLSNDEVVSRLPYQTLKTWADSEFTFDCEAPANVLVESKGRRKQQNGFLILQHQKVTRAGQQATPAAQFPGLLQLEKGILHLRKFVWTYIMDDDAPALIP